MGLSSYAKSQIILQGRLSVIASAYSGVRLGEQVEAIKIAAFLINTAIDRGEKTEERNPKLFQQFFHLRRCQPQQHLCA